MRKPSPLPLVARLAGFGERAAIVDFEGRWTYRDLAHASAAVAALLLAGRHDLDEERVAFLLPPGFGWAAVLLGIWRAGGIAVPLALSHPPAELAHVLEDAGASLAVASGELAERLAPLCRTRQVKLLRHPLDRPHPTGADADSGAQGVAAALDRAPAAGQDRAAMILYTSGTSGRPKGVVWTHRALGVQVDTLLEAWGWSPDDRALHVLPLHHVHGIFNLLLCALGAGATCEMLPRFDAALVWRRLAGGEVTVFMAVPTLYARLLAAWEAGTPEERRWWSEGARRLRLMVSGSAPLPVQLLERWRGATGHTLLERYGMTEIGMALSNSLDGERVPGAVGKPLPGVEVRIVDEAGRDVRPGEPGELRVRGPGIFRGYWRRPEATAEAFADGWFRTGDVAVCQEAVYRLLGRLSQDIIKTGGYKVSALEIETALRDHPAIADCAVVGVPDAEWGERVAVAVVLRKRPAGSAAPAPSGTEGPGPGAAEAPGAAGTALDLESLRAWARERLAPYKVPTLFRVVDDFPRNAMGKVVKAKLAEAWARSA